MVELLTEAERLGAELPVAVAREIASTANVPACLQGLSPAGRRDALLNLLGGGNGMPAASFGVALLTGGDQRGGAEAAGVDRAGVDGAGVG